ncbi:serine hydrolase [Actinocatenispora rupis]|uniref:Serine hydrolase n=1 Tax=Actinocatenispora rupis TaxID=519421 RepID=A0A8J3J3B9_9ACTN|nr:serine hydrolase [Actinocatenispora rupis]GID09384.1 serine hydrolase [Actinocatenispora rupis]
MTLPHLAALDPVLAAAPGTVSVYVGPLSGPPAYTRLPDAPHYAASTMKAALLATAYRLADADAVDLAEELAVHDEFGSAAPDGGRFAMRHSYDNDDEVWARLGRTAPLEWLLRRMIVRSSNLATNLVLERIGTPAVAHTLADAGAAVMVVGRGIEDGAAEHAGRTNRVTAADLARLLASIADHRIASPASCAAMMEILLAQECTEDLAAGLPPGTRIAHKNGWVDGIRHGAGVVLPDDAPAYAVAVCTTTDLGDDAACRLVADVSAAAWADRHAIA